MKIETNFKGNLLQLQCGKANNRIQYYKLYAKVDGWQIVH